jgi:hypothetical protein
MTLAERIRSREGSCACPLAREREHLTTCRRWQPLWLREKARRGLPVKDLTNS